MSLLRSTLFAAAVACSGPKDLEAPCEPETWYTDADGDGFGAAALEACEPPPGASQDSGDCDDGAPDVHPGAIERCNGRDDDCDAAVDEPDATDAGTWFADRDGDGFGDPTSPEAACGAPAGQVADATDCDDARPDVHPGADEHCDGVDEDCNDVVDDPTAVDAIEWFEDADGDGHGSATSVVQCEPPPGWAPVGDDCDDQEPLVSPSAAERCDALDLDEDCDGLADDVDPSVDPASAGDFYWDDDSDGYGDPDAPLRACDAPPGAVADRTDCDDDAAGTHPGATEHCDGVDEDCDLAADDDAVDRSPWYADTDLDGYGDPASEAVDCYAPPGWIAVGQDCDDDDPDRHPGATERCSGVDEDCNGVEDDPYAADAPTWHEDLDQDGHGSDVQEPACDQPPGWVSVGGDCDDQDGAVSPDGVEICDPEDADEDCDGLADGDCDDADATRSPGAEETCDPVDLDCSGDPYDALVGLSTWYPDGDGDGYGADTGSMAACLAPPGYVGVPGDCDDLEPAVHPGAPELCWDAVDDDCDGAVEPSLDGDCGLLGTLAIGSAADASFGAIVSGVGAAVALADLDGDGLDDVVVSAPAAGQVSVFLAPLDPSSGGLDATFYGPAGFGSALARVRDFDGDGVDDLAIGSPDEDGAAGAVYVFRGGSGLAPSVLTGDAWLRLGGEAAGDDAGEALAGGADVDGDGLGDLLVGAPDAGGKDEGAAYLVRGGTLPSDLASADLVLRGELPRDAAGGSVAFAGDVDGDGTEDLLVGACDSADRAAGAGEAYLIRGPLPQGEVELALADASLLGTVADGEAGCAVAGLGDLDGDGYDDVAVGAPGDGAGSVAIFRGPIHPARHPLASAPFTLHGAAVGDRFGAVVAGGDVDGDGRPDLVVGAPEDAASGAAFLFYGPPAAIALAADADATITGTSAGDDLPAAVAVGDVDGDGFADLLLGSTRASANQGRAWLIRGGPVGPPAAPAATVVLSDDADGDGWTEAGGDCDDTRAGAAPGQVEVCENLLDDDCDGRDDVCAILGPIDPLAASASFDAGLATSGEYRGRHVGDIDGDGFSDVIVEGQHLYLFLGPIPWGPWFHADADGRILTYSDTRVDALGDFDGDGIDDFVVSNHPNSGADGKVHVFLGASDIALRTSLDEADLVIEASLNSSLPAIAPAGDLNGDGLADLVVGAPHVDDLFFQGGEAYVFYGGRPPGVWSADQADVIIDGEATTSTGTEVAGVGDVDGDGWPDVLVSVGTPDLPFLHFAYYLLRGPLDPRPDLSAAHAIFVGGRFYEGLYPAGDLDGDGHRDLVLPDPERDRAAVFFGPIGPGLRLLDDADLLIEGGEGFGAEIATAGDLDGDGYGDLQVRRLDYMTNAMSLHLFYGPLPRSGVLFEADADASLSLPGWETFPLAPAADLDGDGYDDLLVAETDNDAVHLLRGGRRGDPVYHQVILDPLADTDLDGFSPAGGDCDDTRPTVFPGGVEICEDGFDQDCDGADRRCAPLGTILLENALYLELDRSTGRDGGDLDGDGLADLIVGGDAGVTVLMAPVPFFALDLDQVTAGTAPGGAVIEAGDVDADGLADVLFTTDVPGEVRLASGVDLGQVSATLLLANTPGALLLADTTGDGTDDPIVVMDLIGSGTVMTFAGPLGPALTEADASSTIVGDAATIRLSASAAGDVDGDGLADLLLGSPLDAAGGIARGRAFLMFAPLPPAADLGAADSIIEGVVDRGDLGESVGITGDVTGDGMGDFAIGAIDEDIGGAVRLFTSLPGPSVIGGGDVRFEGANVSGRLGVGISEPMDLDGDGVLDIALGDGWSSIGSGEQVFLFYGPIPGAGTFTTAEADASFYGPGIGAVRTIRTAGDTDGDGTDDVLVGRWLLPGGLR
jgi:hypothetical protein